MYEGENKYMYTFDPELSFEGRRKIQNEDGLIMSKAANIWNLMQPTPHRHTHYKP